MSTTVPRTTRLAGAGAATRIGFTLLELLIVLAVIGITLGAVGPAFTLARPGTTEGPAAAVASVLTAARETALKSASEATVTFDPTARRAWVRALGATPPLDTSFALTLTRGDELASNVARPRFRFAANGRATGDQLIVSSPRTRSLVAVDQYSGDVKIRSIGAQANARR